MICSQRGSSFTSDGFTLDRFERQENTDGAYTVTQSTTSPDGFANSLKVDVTTADTSLSAGQYANLKYKIEAQDLQDLAFGTSAAKTVVLSFYVRSNKTGNYAFAIQQSDNSFKLASFQYTINSADTWERKTIVIAGDTSGVINNDNGDGFILLWAFAAGSNYTTGTLRSTFTARVAADQYVGQGVNLLDSTSNEWYITGVQLEVDQTGSGVATDFEHRSFAQELALCQRYCYAVPVGSTGHNYHAIMNGFYVNSSLFIGLLNLPTVMRGSPSLTTSGSFQTAGTASISVGSFTLNDVDFDNVHSIQFRCTGSGATAGQGANFRNDASNTAKFILSAEL
tara:strand:- start:261 stop:1277 length:1017 start_codon:yes stop_codon:yes gene_type:complete